MVAACCVIFVASLGQTVVAPALPIIVAELNGLDRLTWVITAYLLASTIGAPVCGKLGDLYGRKVVLQAALCLFLLGSLICGVAESMTMLIVGRTVQGLAGGGLIVVSMAVAAETLPPLQRGRAQGIMSGVFGVSTVVGPLVGGLTVGHFSWHWIFFFNLPVGLAALLVLSRILPGRRGGAAVSLDILGAGLLAAILSCLVLLGSLGGTLLPWGSAEMFALAGLCAAAIAAFAWAESVAREPILPLSLFRNNSFLVVNSVGMMVGAAMFGTLTFMPLYLQIAKGVSPAASGLFLVPMMMGLIGGSILAGRQMSRTGRYKAMPLASTAVLAVAMLLLSTVSPQTPLWLVVGYMILTGIGIGPVMSVGVAAIQNAVPMRILGVATASANMFRLIGGSLGTSVFGAMFAAGLARRLADVLPEGASASFGSLSATAVAALPEAAQDGVRSALTGALHPVFAVAAVLACTACALTLALRELPLSDQLAPVPADADPADMPPGAVQAAAPQARNAAR